MSMHNCQENGYAGQHAAGHRFRKPVPATRVGPVSHSLTGPNANP